MFRIPNSQLLSKGVVMKKNTRTCFIGILVVAILLVADPVGTLFAGNSSGQRGEFCPYASAGKFKKDMESKFFKKAHVFLAKKEELGLSDEQINTIKELKLNVKKEIIRHNSDIQIAALDIKSQTHVIEMDTGALDLLIDQKYEYKKAKAKMLMQAYAELKTILTTEQHDKLSEIQS